MEKLPKTAWCVGFSLWKKAFVRRFLQGKVEYIRFVSTYHHSAFAPAPHDVLVTWGRKNDLGVLHEYGSMPHWRIEDGFVRSVGLGADLCRPASLVIDTTGIYYDSTKPNDLEYILQTHSFTPVELLRARKLIDTICASGLSKYNLKGTVKPVWKSKHNRKIILITGQVDDDASVLLGCSTDIKTNEALIKHVRMTNLDAFIVYKPHPDVTSGNRQGTVSQDLLDECVDHVTVDTNIIDCLSEVDEVHTLTSLTGFEALLRAIPVYCYGQPFYSGWGLTVDYFSCPQRTRKLSIEELGHGCLIQYAMYYDWDAHVISTAENIVAKFNGVSWNKSCKLIKKLPRRVVRSVQKIRFLMEALNG